MREHELYGQIAQYLQLRYPNVIYRFDLAADIKLTVGQAAKHKRLHPKRGYPDLFIAVPKLRRNKDGLHVYTHGLYMEIKREGVKILKRNGEYVADKHIREQAAMLQELELLGYRAVFAVGFDQAKQIIDDYMAI